MTGKAASIVLHSQYSQELLETSDQFKQGYIKLYRTDEGGETPVPEPDPIVVEEVKSTVQLMEFVAKNFDKVYQRPDAALTFAKNKGYEFPNLDMNKS